ncbi:Riboflavin synthase-like superfamily protein [Raphanus sativus]|uniref:Respiratory burst oxidase homolog protein E isoform X2 n=1 Tax=Raphanus sativus TaxID=3726 RepID=A0A6J0M9K9_RAPSA|nr:respiratory burst oxidase homolog protein E isoform X2 [Raphanus sativus]KAJ4916167.1 Riboflavin synthase-like superfamily protein [Raphanus sativus]
MKLSPLSFSTSSSFSHGADETHDVDGVELRPSPVTGGAMLPVFLNGLSRNGDSGSGSSWERELVEVTLELDGDSNSIVVCGMSEAATSADSRPRSGRLTRSLSTTPTRIRQTIGRLLRSDSTRTTTSSASCDRDVERHTAAETAGKLTRSLSTASARIRKTFGKLLRSDSTASRDVERLGAAGTETPIMSARDRRRVDAKLQRTTSSAQRALKGLQFINKTTKGNSCGCDRDCDCDQMWKKVEKRFETLSKEGLLAREDFGECVGMKDSKEFAVSVFDALARRRRQKLEKITRDELHDFWLQISDQSFDARLQIFFDMVDSNEDGRITSEEIKELLMLSASANKLAKLKEQAEEYASLIMEELDPENLGYIELWQLETLLLQRDAYMNYSRPLSTTSVGMSGMSSPRRNLIRPRHVVRKCKQTLQCLVLDNWQRIWVLLLWVIVMALLFVWKFFQYRDKAAFKVMGYCLTTAKGAAETLKLNMALVLLPVCRNTLTWLRSTRARAFVPFDDNINFHKIVACAIVIGILVHAGTHLACDFPRIINSSPEHFALIASYFNGVKPTFKDLMTGAEGITGISMVILTTIAFTLASTHFRRNRVRLPAPLDRLTGFNAFWYTHHLLVVVYILLIVHGTFLFFSDKWYQKTTWMYISVPLVVYVAERSLRACRSQHYSVKILKVSMLPGEVLSLIMSKPPGFKYKSGQYIFLQCPTISRFEWHPFSITSAPGDDQLSVHIRTLGDWTEELQRVLTVGKDLSTCVIGRSKFSAYGNSDPSQRPKLLVDGPYGAPAQDYKKYDVLLLIGLGIGATPFISILKDLLNNSREEQTENEFSRSDFSCNSYSSSYTTVTPSSTQGGKKKSVKAHFYWVTREPGSVEWFRGVMEEISDMDCREQIELHNYLTSVYDEGDARSTLIKMVQALNHAKHGVDILSGTRVRTHFARPNWKEVFSSIARKHPNSTVGVFYCGIPTVAKELKKQAQEMSQKTSTRFEFHKEHF